MNINALTGQEQDHLARFTSNHKLHRGILTPFSQLQQAASEHGIALFIVSSFRSFDRQLAIWNGKFTGERTVYDDKNHPIDMSQLDEWEKCQAILRFSALPGASRHHWGTDLDVFDRNAVSNSYQVELTHQEYSYDGPFSKLVSFLEDHAEKFGFFLPYQHYQGGVAREPWHISYQPLATHFQSRLSTQALRDVISTANIEGRASILANLDLIVEQYVMNICQPTTPESGS